MNDTLVADTLNGYFKTEISNKVERKKNCIIVKLTNGEKAKISIISLS